MTIIKSTSSPNNLNKENLENKLKETNSYNDFEKLVLLGQQKLLTFGDYNQIENSSKDNKRKVIYYFYKNIKSKL